MISANVPSAKKIIVHGPDLTSIPSQFPVHEVTCSSILIIGSRSLKVIHVYNIHVITMLSSTGMIFSTFFLALCYPPPMESGGGYSFGVVRPSVRPNFVSGVVL
jgi:hypothetical protein